MTFFVLIAVEHSPTQVSSEQKNIYKDGASRAKIARDVGATGGSYCRQCVKGRRTKDGDSLSVCGNAMHCASTSFRRGRLDACLLYTTMCCCQPINSSVIHLFQICVIVLIMIMCNYNYVLINRLWRGEWLAWKARLGVQEIANTFYGYKVYTLLHG